LLVQVHNINASYYQDVWDFQTILHNKIKQYKRHRNRDSAETKDMGYMLNHLVFCEHLPVYTLGKSAQSSNLLLDAARLKQKGFEVYKINRGGDITYHGPGQVTGYYILDVESLYRDVHRYVRNLEQIIIELLSSYSIEGIRLEDFTGVWVQDGKSYKKICAIGVHLSRWVSMHGFGLNVNTAMDHFQNIIPCGIEDDNKSVSSIAKLLGREVDIVEVISRLTKISCDIFGLEIIK